jgi:ABC transport system ATP-binding/permease protein
MLVSRASTPAISQPLPRNVSEIGFDSLSMSFGQGALLDETGMQIERGERVGLLGRNGCGKSTLLKILAGEQPPDSGEVLRRKGLTVASLSQEVPRELAGTVRENLHVPLEGIEAHGEWENDEKIERIARSLGLNLDDNVAGQSAGQSRRVLLAKALIQEPDLLILDEPTNHLDISAVQALEEIMQRWKGSVIFVTHDRAFLRKIATRILDLDRGKLESYECDYATYLVRKEANLLAEEQQNAVFDKKLAQEEVWIRGGIKARRTRNQGRVRALKAMREERADRRDKTGKVKATLQEGGRTGQIVMRAKGLTQRFGDKTVLSDLTLEIQRGDRVGLVGPNGSGKTTLLRILQEELSPTEGEVLHGTNLQIGRFDQLHDLLNDSLTVRENVCDAGDSVRVGDGHRHIMGYLQDFLFTPDQIQGPITRLSGGERNRLQLAKLMARPANLLILDEPTNDLDLETLELLEELLVGFTGTLLIVSHDREFLDNVVTSCLIFDGETHVRESIGGYTDDLERQAKLAAPKAAEKQKAASKKGKPKEPQARRLTFKEKKELEALPAQLEKLEASKESLLAEMASPEFFRRDGEEIAKDTAKLEQIENELTQCYTRWEELELIAEAS